MQNERNIVANHYNNISNKSNSERNKSRIIKLKYFNNNLKKYLIGANILRGSLIFDMGIGKGGDIHKYNYVEPKLLYGVDIATSSLLDCIDRIETSDILFKFIVKTANIFEDKINLNVKFDYFSSQFSFHYSFFSEKGFYIGMENINKIMKTDYSTILLTMPDKNRILERKRKGNLKNSIYSIRFDDDWVDKKFGSTYSFSLEDSVDDCIEPLVCKETLLRAFSEIGFRCIYNESFNLHAQKQNKESFYNQWAELSPEEKDVVSLYDIFVFKRGYN